MTQSMEPHSTPSPAEDAAPAEGSATTHANEPAPSPSTGAPAGRAGVGLQTLAADQLRARGDLGRAEEAYRSVVTEVPEHVPAVVRLAELLGQAERLVEARAVVDAGLEVSPGAAPLLAQRAVFRLIEGDPEGRHGTTEPLRVLGGKQGDGRRRVGEHERITDRSPVNALACRKVIERGKERRRNVIARDETATTERTPGERHDAISHAEVERAVPQRPQCGRRVFRLARGEREVAQMGDERIMLRRRVVRDADGADFAVSHQLGQRGGDLGRMSEHVGAVDLIEVDHVDAESAQAGIDGRPQIRVARVVRDGRHDPAFGGQHHLVAQMRSLGEDLPEQFLVATETRAVVVEAVHVGGVDQVHAEIEGGLDEFLGRSQIVGGEAPGAETQRTDGIETRGQRSRPGLDQRVRHGAYANARM